MKVEREIQKENAIREIVNAEAKKLKPILTPFIGRRIRKVDGQLIKKLSDQIQFDKDIKIEPLTKDGHAKLHYIYLSSSDYSLTLRLSICYSGGSYDDRTYYCEYKDNSYCIGDIAEHKILAEITEFDLAPLDIQEQRKQYDKVRKLSVVLEKEKDKLWYGLLIPLGL